MDFRTNNSAKMISTPLRENNRRYTHSPLLSPGSRLIKNRYCVSDISSPNSKTSINYSPGPLLTPTNYNTNLSTYIDCKSPGLSGRIVQYNNDASEPFVSHQAKYGSPGLFPIVHLQKKDLPVRKLPRDTVTVRLMATHESPKYIVNNSNGVHNDNDTSDISTSSVLKALREISKKRAFSEDLTVVENNHKRHRNDHHADVSEARSNLNNSSITKTTSDLSKKSDDIPCVVDAVAASLTSSNTALVNSRNLLKRKINKPIKTSATSPKQMLIEVETQTDTLKVNNVTQTVEVKPVAPVVSKTITSRSAEVDSSALVYENTLKDKLSTRLSTFMGGKPPADSPNSILSPSDKVKHDKHVSFKLHEDEVDKSVDQNSIVPTTSVSQFGDKLGLSAPVVSLEEPVTSKVTEPSPAITLPPFSTSVSFTVPKSDVITTKPSTSDVAKLTTSLFTPPTTTSTSLDLPKLSSPSLFSVLPTSTPSVTVPSSILPTSNPVLNQEKPVTTSSLIFSPLPSTELKFSNTSASTTQAAFSLSKSLTNVTSVLTSITPTPVSFTEQKSFNNNKLESTSTPISVFTTNTLQQNTPNEKTGVSLGFNIPPPNKPGGFKFEFGSSTSVAPFTTKETKVEPTFSFGNPAPSTNLNFGGNTKVTSAFGASSIFSTGFETKSPSNVGFSTPKEVSQNDSKLTFTPSVVTTSNQMPSGQKLFDFTPKCDGAASAFNTQTTGNSNMFKFGSATTTTATSSVFSTPSVVNSIQTSSDLNMFKFSGPVTTAPAPFNATTLSTSNESNTFKFGAAVFNSPTAFKDNKQQPVSEPSFKFTSTTLAPPAFSAPTFNTVQNQKESNTFKFGAATTTTTASIFNNPQFNNVSQNQNEQKSFQFGGAVTTTAAPIFNATTPAFNFTASTNTSVSKPPPSFPTTTASFSTFGSFDSNPPNPFNSSGFGATKVAPFGTNQAFGVESNPTSIFGAPPPTQNAFGSFNNSNNNQTPFAAPVAAPSLPPAPTQPYQFGATSNNPPTNVFSFGGNAEPAKQPATCMPSSVFSFGASTTNNNFGAAPAPTFGAPSQTFGTPVAPSNFGTSVPPTNNFGMQAPTVPSFGSAMPATPMFNIGAGSSAPKPARTQLKARRRT